MQEVDGVDLGKEIREWDETGKPAIKRLDYAEMGPWTAVMVIDVEGGVWLGCSKQHDEEPTRSRKAALLVAMQRSQLVGNVSDMMDDIWEVLGEDD